MGDFILENLDRIFRIEQQNKGNQIHLFVLDSQFYVVHYLENEKKKTVLY